MDAPPRRVEERTPARQRGICERGRAGKLLVSLSKPPTLFPQTNCSPPHLQLAHPKFRSHRLSFPELRSLVATNAKQRFALAPTTTAASQPEPDDATQWRIRATQGHSIPLGP